MSILSPDWPSNLYGSALTAGVVAAAFGLSACSSSSSTNATVSQVGGPAETNANYPGALVFPEAYDKPNVTLTDTDNQPFDIASDTGSKVTLVYFGYTHVPISAPSTCIPPHRPSGRCPRRTAAR